jgi:DNA-binding NtrC family response regulator
VTAAAESVALAKAQVRAEAVAAGAELPLTLERALDFICTEMSKDAAPLLPRVEHALIARVLQAESGDQAKAAHRLGLTKAALKKRLAEAEGGA